MTSASHDSLQDGGTVVLSPDLKSAAVGIEDEGRLVEAFQIALKESMKLFYCTMTRELEIQSENGVLEDLGSEIAWNFDFDETENETQCFERMQTELMENIRRMYWFSFQEDHVCDTMPAFRICFHLVRHPVTGIF